MIFWGWSTKDTTLLLDLGGQGGREGSPAAWTLLDILSESIAFLPHLPVGFEVETCNMNITWTVPKPF